MNKTYLALAFVLTLILFSVSKMHLKEQECAVVSENTTINCLENNKRNCKQKGVEAYFKCKER